MISLTQAEQSAIDTFDVEKYTILIVDDNPTNLGLIVEYLEEYGMNIIVSQDGESGLRRAQYAKPHLILLDVLMPGIDGFETCRRLKSNLSTQDIPIIFMTALASTEDKVKGFEYGAVDYITKPIQQEEVLARIKLHLSLYALTTDLAEKTRISAQQNLQLKQEIQHRQATELQLQMSNRRLQEEIHDRQQAEAALKQLNQQLERRVDQRTAELHKINQQLKQEISQHQQSKDALWESEVLYRQMVETASEGIWILDVENQITFANCKMADMLGYRVSEIIGHSLFQFMDQEWIQLIQSRLSNGTLDQPEQYDCKLLRRDGSELWVIFSTQPISDIEGGLTGSLGMMMDITERKHAEELLKASLQEKEILLKEIHHRVKNNLLVVSSLLEFQTEYIHNPDIVRMFEESQNRIYSMALIHEQLYRSTNLAQVNFEDYLKSLVKNLSESYHISSFLDVGTHKINFQFNTEPVHLTIESAHPCGLIVNELISNALKYAFPNNGSGTISLSLYQEPSQEIVLTVKDDGVGVADNIDFRATESLGLQLVCTLTDQLEGSIELDRSHGTAFHLRFFEPIYQQRV